MLNALYVLLHVGSHAFVKVPAIWASIATALPLIALFFGFRSYWLKWGVQVRGTFGITSSIECEDDFVHSVILENLKDRAVTIFALYLRIGTNLYLEIEDFGDTPLILKGFETVTKTYGPLEFYSLNGNRWKVRELLMSQNVKKRLILSTSQGRYVVRKPIAHWSPVNLFFKNHFTAIIRPARPTFKGKSFGSNAVFAIVFKLKDGTENTVALYPHDYQVVKFRDFQLTQEALESKDALKRFLDQKRNEGVLKVSEVEVFDLNQLKGTDFQPTRTIDGREMNALTYYIIGPVVTRFRDFQLRRENKRTAKQRAVKSQKGAKSRASLPKSSSGQHIQ
jgi:hypothetical protein